MKMSIIIMTSILKYFWSSYSRTSLDVWIFKEARLKPMRKQINTLLIILDAAVYINMSKDADGLK